MPATQDTVGDSAVLAPSAAVLPSAAVPTSTTPTVGLTNAEAARRRGTEGRSELPHVAQAGPLAIAGRQLIDPVLLVLLAAAASGLLARRLGGPRLRSRDPSEGRTPSQHSRTSVGQDNASREPTV